MYRSSKRDESVKGNCWCVDFVIGGGCPTLPRNQPVFKLCALLAQADLIHFSVSNSDH